MVLHLDEFSKEQFTGYVENVPPQREYVLANFLPARPIKDINFSYNVVNGKYSKAASITGFNASAPLRDKKEMEKAFGSVAKVQHGVRLDEEELFRFNKPRDDEERQMVIDYVYDTTDDLVWGVQDIEEYMRASAVYRGELDYKDEENDLEVKVDFGIPEENKLNATVSWGEENAKPLQDIAAALDQYKKTNQRRKPQVMHMTSATEAKLLSNDSVRFQIYGESTGERLVTKDQLQNVFNALGFPPYQINDDVVAVFDAEEQLLEDDKVVFLGDNLGETYRGPTVEKNYEAGIYVSTEIQETNPPYEAVYVGETVFPALKRPHAIVHLSV